ncbi:MAG: arginine--tRNA ligase [bacterium]
MIVEDALKDIGDIIRDMGIEPGDSFLSFSEHADLSSNIAFALAGRMKKPPMDIALQLKEKIESIDYIERVETAKPGFINIFLTDSTVSREIVNVLESDNYGSMPEKSQKVNFEFISANPTGPLVVVNARAGIVGSLLANIMNYSGIEAVREFYVNDSGNQVRKLGESILWHIADKKPAFPENGYRGEYIKEIAVSIEKKRGKLEWSDENIELCAVSGKKHIIKWQKESLERYNIVFDNWVYESDVIAEGMIDEVLGILKSKDMIYEKDGAVFFKTSGVSNDEDRVIVKSDGNYSYFLPDIAYHYYKIKRGFLRMIDILGPDHHGYIDRIKGAVQVLSEGAVLEVIIAQLITLLKDGRQFEMSKRKGDFITMDELADEIDPDVVKFMFLTRKLSQPMDFDIDEAMKTTMDNPLYYVQYAHARICSIFSRAESIEQAGSIESLLEVPLARELAVKIFEYPYVLYGIARHYEIQKLTNYLIELSRILHKFYYKYRVISEEREDMAMKMMLIDAVRKIIAHGLDMMNIKPKERMEDE